jgi:group I intron endonuclease
LVNGKSYIGSSVNLALRLRNYFNFSFISNKRRGKSLINEALLKYGYSYFSLEILEFCESSEAILREQYYLDLLKPEYNILKNAGSSLGRKHSEETKARLKGRTLTAEHIAKLKAKTLTTEHIAKIKA